MDKILPTNFNWKDYIRLNEDLRYIENKFDAVTLKDSFFKEEAEKLEEFVAVVTVMRSAVNPDDRANSTASLTEESEEITTSSLSSSVYLIIRASEATPSLSATADFNWSTESEVALIL